MKESIEQREDILKWEHKKELEWQTQSLAVMVANTVEHDKARKELVDIAKSLTLTGTKTASVKAKTPKTYKTINGDVIPASEIYKYEYHEIDHTEEDTLRRAAARANNKGKNIASMF